MPFAGGIFQRHKVALLRIGLVLIGCGTMIDQPAGPLVGERLDISIECHAVAMSRHGDIGQVAVHRGGRQHKGPIDGRALVLVDRRRVAVINRLVTVHGYVDDIRPISRSPVELHMYHVMLDGEHASEHPVLHPEIAIVLQEHDAVALGKVPATIIRLVGQRPWPILSAITSYPLPFIRIAGQDDLRQFTAALKF